MIHSTFLTSNWFQYSWFMRLIGYNIQKFLERSCYCFLNINIFSCRYGFTGFLLKKFTKSIVNYHFFITLSIFFRIDSQLPTHTMQLFHCLLYYWHKCSTFILLCVSMKWLRELKQLTQSEQKFSFLFQIKILLV